MKTFLVYAHPENWQELAEERDSRLIIDEQKRCVLLLVTDTYAINILADASVPFERPS